MADCKNNNFVAFHVKERAVVANPKAPLAEAGFSQLFGEAEGLLLSGVDSLGSGFTGISQTLAGSWKTRFRMAGTQGRNFCRWLLLARLRVQVFT